MLGFNRLVVPCAPTKLAGLLEVWVFKQNYTPPDIYTLTVQFWALVVPVLSLLLAIMADMSKGLLTISDEGQGRARVFCVEHGGLVMGALWVFSCVISMRWDGNRGGLFNDGGN